MMKVTTFFALGFQHFLVVSELLMLELKPSPENVQNVLKDFPPSCLEFFEDSEEIEGLRNAYIEAGVVGKASF